MVEIIFFIIILYVIGMIVTSFIVGFLSEYNHSAVDYSDDVAIISIFWIIFVPVILLCEILVAVSKFGKICRDIIEDWEYRHRIGKD